MLMGSICTRRCPFCDVAHGTPKPLDTEEPQRLAATVTEMGLSYVVITSVNRDDLRDGGASHYAATIRAIREHSPGCQVEVLVPDFRGRQEVALQQLAIEPADVFNHNLETVPRLYREVRPGGDYKQSLLLLQRHKQQHPELPTKSGLMLGLGEELDEVKQVMQDLRAHGCNMLTLGQYLQPSREHLPVHRFVHPQEFTQLQKAGDEMGFSAIASAPMVRSSYHAATQAQGVNRD
jgi:lipoic acid synthetase